VQRAARGGHAEAFREMTQLRQCLASRADNMRHVLVIVFVFDHYNIRPQI